MLTQPHPPHQYDEIKHAISLSSAPDMLEIMRAFEQIQAKFLNVSPEEVTLENSGSCWESGCDVEYELVFVRRALNPNYQAELAEYHRLSFEWAEAQRRVEHEFRMRNDIYYQSMIAKREYKEQRQRERSARREKTLGERITSVLEGVNSK